MQKLYSSESKKDTVFEVLFLSNDAIVTIYFSLKCHIGTPFLLYLGQNSGLNFSVVDAHLLKLLVENP